MITTTAYITRLPELTPRARELQLAIDFWKKQYQEARVLSGAAWKMYNAAIDNEDGRETIDQLYGHAVLADDIAIDAWGKWQAAKAELLAFYN